MCQFDREYFWNTGLTVMLAAADKPLAYHKPEVQEQIVLFLDKLVALPSFSNASVISWLVMVSIMFFFLIIEITRAYQ